MAVSLILTRNEMQATEKADIYRGVTPAAWGDSEPAAGVACVVVAGLCAAPSSAAAVALAAAGVAISML